VYLDIADYGVGFDVRQQETSGLGLVSMQERVSLAKGRLAIDTAPGQGTRISVRIPLVMHRAAVAV
jgi:signal transduction histidine kinase